jgi:acetoin utilization protein AcuB
MTTGKDIMTSRVFTITADRPIIEAARLMKDKNIRHLPVTNHLGTVVGILSDRDLQRAMNVLEKFSVEDFMSWPVYCVSESTPVKRIAEEMIAQKVSAFLVEDLNGHLKGIITTDDLLRLIIEEKSVKEQIGLRALGQYFTGPELY